MIDAKTIDNNVARLLMVAFFLPSRWQATLVVAAGLYFVVRALFIKVVPRRTNIATAFALGGIFLLYLSAVLITEPPFRAFLLTLCERKVSLLLMPVIMAVIGQQFRQTIIDQLCWFVYGCLVCCLAANASFIIHHFTTGGPLYQLSHVAYRIAFEQFTGLHPTYMGMFLAFAISILFYSPILRASKYMLFYSLLLFLLALLVKSAIIAIAIILIAEAWARRRSFANYKYQIVGGICILVAAAYFIPFIGQRTGEVLSYIGVGKATTAADNSVHVRKMILDTDLALLRRNWLTGVGPSRVLHLLEQRYFFISLATHTDVSHYDPHNEYLNEWLGFGITGIIVLLLVLGLHFRKAIVTRHRLFLYLLLILSITFFTETVLSRQQGVLFYAVFTSLFFFAFAKNQKEIY